MGQRLGEGNRLQRQRPERNHLQGTVVMVLMEHTVRRKERGQQQRHPENARRNPAEEIEIRAEAERHRGHDDEVKAERGQ
jgi:hypothetical protein